MMIDTILLDIDGTMLDSRSCLLSSLQMAIKKTLNQDIPLSTLEPTMGMHEKDTAALFTDQPEKQQKLQDNWTYYVKNNTTLPKLYPNVLSTLLFLKSRNIKLGIVTSKTKEHMRNDFDKLHINHLFDIIVTSDDIKRPKPDGESIVYALDQLGSDKSASIYVGDTYNDYLAACDAGVGFYLAGRDVAGDSMLRGIENRLGDLGDLKILIL